MTSTPDRTVPHSVDLAARVTTLLACTLPEYVPGVQHEGFRVESLDRSEPRRMFVRWHGGTPTRPMWTHGPALGREKYKAQILEVLTRAGYAVSGVPGRMDVFVADRPHETAGPRFAPVASDIPFTAPWLVMDLWTRAHVAVADSEEEAAAEAMHQERRHALTDARIATAPELWWYLERADELLGDGLSWLRQEVHGEAWHQYGEIVRHERIDALVQVANALQKGREVVQQARLLTYAIPEPMQSRVHTPLTYRVRWVPKSPAPAVGYFPAWERSPAVDAAVTALMTAGMRPVVYGESIGPGAYQCEQSGFMASAAHDGIRLDNIGADGEGELERAPEVLRAAGWRVEPDGTWPGAWTAFPPAG